MSTRISLKDINLKPYISTWTNVAYEISVERIVAYDDKETFFIDFHATCWDSPTLNINWLWAKNIIINWINVVNSQLTSNLWYFIKYSSSLDKFVVVGWGNWWTMNCSDVKDCIENFTDLDLSNLQSLVLSWDINFNQNTNIDWTNTNNTWIQNFDDNYEANYNSSDINYNWWIQNFNDVEQNYSWDSVINYWWNSQINYWESTDINVSWDMYVENFEVKNFTVNWWKIVINAIVDKDDQVYNGTDLNRTLPSTPLSENALHITTDSGTNLILWVDYSVANNIITWIIAPNTWEHIYAWWLVWQANTVPGWQAYYQEYVANGGETDIPLNDTPAGANWIWVSTESSLYGKQWVTRDWTYDVGNNKIVMWYALQPGDVVSIQYIGFMAQPLDPIKKVSDVVWTWPSTQLVVTDDDCSPDSVIMGWTVKSGTQVGFWQFTLAEGGFTIDSTDSESWLVFNYVIYK